MGLRSDVPDVLHLHAQVGNITVSVPVCQITKYSGSNASRLPLWYRFRDLLPGQFWGLNLRNLLELPLAHSVPPQFLSPS